MSELFRAVMAAGQGPGREVGEGWISRDFLFGEEFLGFAGHFPGNPVLPAIVQIMAGASLASGWHGVAPEVRNVKNAKFLAPVPPGSLLTVLARVLEPDGCEVRIMLGERPVSTFILGFAKAV